MTFGMLWKECSRQRTHFRLERMEKRALLIEESTERPWECRGKLTKLQRTENKQALRKALAKLWSRMETTEEGHLSGRLQFYLLQGTVRRYVEKLRIINVLSSSSFLNCGDLKIRQSVMRRKRFTQICFNLKFRRYSPSRQFMTYMYVTCAN